MAFVDVRMPPGWTGSNHGQIWQKVSDLQVSSARLFGLFVGEMLKKLGYSDRLVILKKRSSMKFCNWPFP